MPNYSPNTTLYANQLHQADDDYIQPKHVAGLHIKLCLDCNFASFLFSLYRVFHYLRTLLQDVIS